MATMADIEKLQREYAAVKASLEAVKADLDSDVLALRKKYETRLKSVINRLTEKHSELYREIAENPGLFTKPRTVIVEGIRVGLKKGKGKLHMPDEQLTVQLIKENLPKKQKMLIRTIEEPAKAAILMLPEEELQLIACEIVGKEDQVVIEDVDSAVDKILNSALKIQIEELKDEYREAA